MKKFVLFLVAFFAFTQFAFAAININTATQEELESINGIGPVKAKAIIDYRNQNGRFKSIEDVDNVKGVGKGTLDKLRDQVTLTGGSSPVKSDSKNDGAKKSEDSKSASRSKAADKMPDAKPASAEKPLDMKPEKVKKSDVDAQAMDDKKSSKKSKAEKSEAAPKAVAADKKDDGDKKSKADDKKKEKKSKKDSEDSKDDKADKKDKK